MIIFKTVKKDFLRVFPRFFFQSLANSSDWHHLRSSLDKTTVWCPNEMIKMFDYIIVSIKMSLCLLGYIWLMWYLLGNMFSQVFLVELCEMFSFIRISFFLLSYAKHYELTFLECTKTLSARCIKCIIFFKKSCLTPVTWTIYSAFKSESCVNLTSDSNRMVIFR